MRLPRVRFTMRTLMVGVALSAILIVGGRAWWRRCVFCRDKANFFMKLEAENRAAIAMLPMQIAQGDPAAMREMEDVAELKWGSSARSVPLAFKQAESITQMARGYHRRIDHQAAWRKRYMRAMFLPWEAAPEKPPRLPGYPWN